MPIGDLIYVDETGLNTPDFATVLSRFQQEYYAIYGIDTVLDPSSQDGEWISIEAKAAYDAIQLLIAVYNSFSPATAQKDALARNLKINGLKIKQATKSQVDLLLIGQGGSLISFGQAGDALNQKWILPISVIIPSSGSILVTAEAENEGATIAPAGSITKILTPTTGWQSVTNPAAAIEGQPVETDANARRRQSQSTMLPSLSVFDGIWGALEKLDQVVEVKGYENATSTADSYGIPPYSMAFVLIGGDNQEIADTIRIKKTGGTPTFGTLSVASTDTHGQITNIKFSKADFATIQVNISITAFDDYVSTTEDLIKTQVSNYINSLKIGSVLYISKLCAPADLYGAVESNTYDVTYIEASKNAGAFVPNQINFLYNEKAICSPSDVVLTVT